MTKVIKGGPSQAAWRPPIWPRLAVVHGLQLLPFLIWHYGQGFWSPLVGGLLGSVICCLGTDSGWRWLNRLLVLEAVCWLLVAMTAFSTVA